MGDLFKALGSGLARFVYAWLMPSVITCGAFVLIVIPNVGGDPIGISFSGAAAFTLAVFGLSVVFAYASRPMYQFLEGYTMPSWMAGPLLRRCQRRFLRLQWLEANGTLLMQQRATEDLKSFPDRVDLLLPTRLGNALKAMEGYGVSRYGLDSQTFWYELQSVAHDKVRRSTEETRAAVDFFMSSIAHLSLLVIVSIGLVPVADHPIPLIGVALTGAVLVPLAYSQAVRNVSEWRWSVQALVNTSRPALAKAFALSLPPSFEAEEQMWMAVSGLVHHGRHDEYLTVLNLRRTIDQVNGNTASGDRDNTAAQLSEPGSAGDSDSGSDAESES